MKKIWVLLLISSSASATQLTFDRLRPTYKIEYNPKTETIKILSKKNGTKICDQEAKSESTKYLIKSGLKNRDKKVITTFTCHLDSY